MVSDQHITRDGAWNGVDPAAPTPDDLAGLLRDLHRFETIFAAWDQAPRSVVEAYRRAIDALHREALRRLIRALKAQPAALAAMKEAVTDEVVYAVLRHHELIKPSLNERVEAALAGVRPMLAAHGGDVQLLKIEPPAVEVRLTGTCDGCASSALTFQAGIRKAIEEHCPEITQIVQAKGRTREQSVRFLSPFATEGHAWLPACAVGEIPEGGILAANIGGERVVLSRRGSVVTCFQDACAHLGLPIHGGRIEGNIISCPHHGFRYDLASGECLTAPEVQLQSHAVRVVGERVEVRLAK
jgi:Fe-S cluster biogenesis protein NfuA/nitrite reductase/ring-hydroxylating ferredoxin subunit